MQRKGATATMSRWIRGRLGRPMASIMSTLMLVTFLLPLAPPPVQAQGEGSIDWSALLDSAKASPIPLVVLDFTNRSPYKVGDLGRNMADALSLELQETKKFAIVPRADVENVMQEMGLTLPMDYSTQALIADRVNAPFTVSGTVEDVSINHTASGTYAELQVSALVVSKITRLPINGVRVVQRSTPKVGYYANDDALVNEALSTAGYQIAQRLLDQRMPMSKVLLATQADEVKIRGGSFFGYRKGMDMVAVRNSSVTGVLHIKAVSPTDSTCEITQNTKGIAPGDYVVPIYDLNYSEDKVVKSEKKKLKYSQTLTGVLGAALLASLIGMSANNDESPAVTAAPMADAGVSGFPYGGNLVRWGKAGRNVEAYVVYRVQSEGSEIPLVVLDKEQTWYVDDMYYPTLAGIDIDDKGVITAAKELNQMLYTVTLQNEGTDVDPIVYISSEYAQTYAWSEKSDGTGDLMPSSVYEWRIERTNEYTLKYWCGYAAGLVSTSSQYAYRVQTIYANYDKGTVSSNPGTSTTTGTTDTTDTGTGTGSNDNTNNNNAVNQHPSHWELYEGDKSPLSDWVRWTRVPELLEAECNPYEDTTFVGVGVPGASQYRLEVSSDRDFTPANTDGQTAYLSNETVDIPVVEAYPFIYTTSVKTVKATFDIATSTKALGGQPVLYVRLGALRTDGPTPEVFRSGNASYRGYVWSAPISYTAPLPSRLMKRAIKGDLQIKSLGAGKTAPARDGARSRILKRN